MTLKFIDDYINEKINKNEEIIIFTFYELRVKCNLSKDEVQQFIELAKTKLCNIGYNVYLTGMKFTYKKTANFVKDNELIVAIKNESGGR